MLCTGRSAAPGRAAELGWRVTGGDWRSGARRAAAAARATPDHCTHQALPTYRLINKNVFLPKCSSNICTLSLLHHKNHCSKTSVSNGKWIFQIRCENRSLFPFDFAFASQKLKYHNTGNETFHS